MKRQINMYSKYLYLGSNICTKVCTNDLYLGTNDLYLGTNDLYLGTYDLIPMYN